MEKPLTAQRARDLTLQAELSIQCDYLRSIEKRIHYAINQGEYETTIPSIGTISSPCINEKFLLQIVSSYEELGFKVAIKRGDNGTYLCINWEPND